MSLATHLRKAAELAAMVQVGGKSPSCNIYTWAIHFMVEPMELVRIFNLLNVRKAALKVTTSEAYTHFRFTARGAEWAAVIEHAAVPAFMEKLGANIQPKLNGTKQPRIGVRPRQPLLIPPAIGGEA